MKKIATFVILATSLFCASTYADDSEEIAKLRERIAKIEKRLSSFVSSGKITEADSEYIRKLRSQARALNRQIIQIKRDSLAKTEAEALANTPRKAKRPVPVSPEEANLDKPLPQQEKVDEEKAEAKQEEKSARRASRPLPSEKRDEVDMPRASGKKDSIWNHMFPF